MLKLCFIYNHELVMVVTNRRKIRLAWRTRWLEASSHGEPRPEHRQGSPDLQAAEPISRRHHRVLLAMTKAGVPGQPACREDMSDAVWICWPLHPRCRWDSQRSSLKDGQTEAVTIPKSHENPTNPYCCAVQSCEE